MLVLLRRSVIAFAVFFVICGLAYPAIETLIGQTFFSQEANGSLTVDGSTLIGQRWNGPEWFHGRPDADNPLTSGGSNFGPHSKALATQTARNIAALRRLGISPTNDLVTSSGSGIDPDITPADALAQVTMIARARGIAPTALRRLITEKTVGPEFGIFGASYVDVLSLNVALAHMAHR
ncbi:MAG: potassium-transporting ATPase subunit C [Acidimicrobiales bacterium]